VKLARDARGGGSAGHFAVSKGFWLDECFAQNHVGVALGPSFKLGHAFEACFFIHSRRLEVIARYPDPVNAATACFRDESIQQCARVTAPSIRPIHPHLFEFRSACPGIASGDADNLSHLVTDYEAQILPIMASGCITIVIVKVMFNCIDLSRREVMPGFYLKGHVVRPVMPRSHS
jgi:hypothetical protein